MTHFMLTQKGRHFNFYNDYIHLSITGWSNFEEVIPKAVEKLECCQASNTRQNKMASKC